jgi:hypothetical protein
MESVFCKDLNNIKYYKILNNQYSFLKENKRYDVNIIYDLLNCQEDYKIKNLYRYIYLRINKLNKSYSQINLLKVNKEDMDSFTFDKLMKSYIKNDKIKEIIIVNCILFYYYPY